MRLRAERGGEFFGDELFFDRTAAGTDDGDRAGGSLEDRGGRSDEGVEGGVGFEAVGGLDVFVEASRCR
jgi:hypothetical protein